MDPNPLGNGHVPIYKIGKTKVAVAHTAAITTGEELNNNRSTTKVLGVDEYICNHQASQMNVGEQNQSICSSKCGWYVSAHQRHE